MNTRRAIASIGVLLVTLIAGCERTSPSPSKEQEPTRALLIAIWTQDTLKPYVEAIAKMVCALQYAQKPPKYTKICPGLPPKGPPEGYVPPGGDNH